MTAREYVPSPQILDREICGAWVGPIWKLGGETCICVEPPGHIYLDAGKPGVGHRCSCGTWFCEEVAHYG